MKMLKQHKSYNGVVQFNEHDSVTTGTKMAFSTFIPEGKLKGCLIWLSGLTCTDENFMAKAGAQKYLAENNLMVICPDTSPRGLNLPNEHESWDFGSAASFYVDATTPGYKDHYKMESYIVSELYALIQKEFKVENRVSIFGHSMGGHGALTLGLRHKEKFKSISAFSPIVNPLQCPWGVKAFTGYFGADRSQWSSHDTCEIVKSGVSHTSEILIDQGTADNFLKEQLLTGNLVEAAAGKPQRFQVRMQEGYDHSYYFIASFVEDHIRFHSERM